MNPSTAAEQAITQLYNDHAPALLRYLRNLTGSREKAEDVAQETFLKALRHWKQLQHKENALAWLFRIARNAAYDNVRRHRRDRTVLMENEMIERFPTPDQCDHVGAVEPIRAALRHLPAHYRILLLIHSVAGYPLDAIAAVLGVKLGTVKSRLQRARTRFRANYTGP